MGKTVKIVLTPAQEAWLIKHFKHTKNDDIAEHLDISPRSVSRIARRLGLEKTKQFMRKCQNESIERMKILNRVNGNYPPKGYQIPNREKGYFKKGVTPLDRLGEKREKVRIEKSVASRKETFKLEKARALYGLPRQTKLRVVQKPVEQRMLRYYLKRNGYIVEREGMVFYYNDQTKRSRAIESRPRTGFTFLPASELTNI